MTKQLALHRRPSSSQLLARILETPNLAEQIQALPSAMLGQLIGHVGIEDAGELVALATTQQLAEVFDEELWRSDRPGEDDRFDADRAETTSRTTAGSMRFSPPTKRWRPTSPASARTVARRRVMSLLLRQQLS